MWHNNDSISDIVGGRPLISCPDEPLPHLAPPSSSSPFYSTTGDNVSGDGGSQMAAQFTAAMFRHPAITITFIFQAALAFLCAFVVVLRWNRLKLFGRQIRSPYLSNHLWVWMFLVWMCECVLNATRYLLSLPYTDSESRLPDDTDDGSGVGVDYHSIDTGLLIGTVVLHAIWLFLLALALIWERRHRIGVIPEAKDFLWSPTTRHGSLSSSTDEDSIVENLGEELGEEQQNVFTSSDPLLPAYATTTSSGDNLPVSNATTLSPLLSNYGTGADNSDALGSRRSSRQQKKHCCRRFKLLLFKRYGRRYRFRFERLAGLLLFLNLATLYLNVTPLPVGDHAFFWSYLASFGLMEIFIVVLAGRVLFAPTSPPSTSTARILSLSGAGGRGEADGAHRPEGPTRLAKLYMVLAVVFGVTMVLPHNLVSRFLYSLAGQDFPVLSTTVPPPPRSDMLMFVRSDEHLYGTDATLKLPVLASTTAVQCIPFLFDGYISYLDLMQWAGTLSFLFWLMFVREEYRRVKERCVWITVTQVQHTFGFASSSGGVGTVSRPDSGSLNCRR